MNEKENLKRLVKRTERNLTKEVIVSQVMIAMGIIFSMLCGVLLAKAKIIAYVIALAVGAGVGLKMWYTEKTIETELRRLWNTIYLTFARHETTLDQILAAAKKEQTREDIIEFIGKKQKERMIDDLALEKLQEKEENHIPKID